jgi:GT2 family glycosyltransferase
VSITALIVSFNSVATLGRCLESVLAGPPVEVVVVDGGSTDGSVALVRERFPQARLLELEQNVGFGAANNCGARLARGDQLLLLNPDAWLDPGALATLSARLAGSPRLAAVAPQLRYPDGTLQYTWVPEAGVLGEAIQRWRNRRSGAWAHTSLERLLRALVGPGWLSAACLLVRRAAFDQVGGFDERFFLYFEDVDLCRRLARAGWRLAKEPAAGAVHVGSVGLREEQRAGTPGRAALEYRRSQLRYYRKHRPAWEVRVVRRRLARRFGAPGVAPALREGVLAALREDEAATAGDHTS